MFQFSGFAGSPRCRTHRGKPVKLDQPQTPLGAAGCARDSAGDPSRRNVGPANVYSPKPGSQTAARGVREAAQRPEGL